MERKQEEDRKRGRRLSDMRKVGINEENVEVK